MMLRITLEFTSYHLAWAFAARINSRHYACSHTNAKVTVWWDEITLASKALKDVAEALEEAGLA